MITTFKIRAVVSAAITSAATGFASTALASGPVSVPPEPEVMIAPAPATPWAGWYLGAGASAVSGGIYQNTAGPTPDFVGANDASLFVGRNWQHGRFVFGGEFSAMHLNTPYVGFPNTFQQNVFELRARAGYAVSDQVLVYGFAGLAASRLDDVGTIVSQSGPTLGLGAEYRVSDHFGVGLEVASRRVSGTFPPPPNNVGTQIDTVTLRLVMRR